VRVFRNLSNVQAGALASACRELRFQAGDVVFRQNSPEQALFIVLEGIVDIVRTEVEEPIATIESGEVFGEMGLIEALPRSAGAVCRNPSRLLVLQPEDFDRFVDGDPEAGVLVLRNLAQILSARLRQQHDAEIFHKQRLEAGDEGDDDDGANG
jgi:CRP-like cAMP-binding protein